MANRRHRAEEAPRAATVVGAPDAVPARRSAGSGSSCWSGSGVGRDGCGRGRRGRRRVGGRLVGGGSFVDMVMMISMLLLLLLLHYPHVFFFENQEDTEVSEPHRQAGTHARTLGAATKEE